jgi:hypothetical protein
MKKLLLSITAFLPLAGLAHPGHGDTGGFTIIHYFTEPEHVLAGLAAIAVVVTVLIRRTAKKESKKI